MIKIRVRAIIGVMIFFGYFLIYIVRYNLSVHIVDMVVSSRQTMHIYYNESDSLHDISSRTGSVIEIMHWNEISIASLLSAYHIGYIICFPLFHNIGDRYGPTWVVGCTGLISGILNCLTPASAYYSLWLLFALRICTGFCAGAMQPSMVQVLRHWMPPTERHHFMWAFCGITTGTFSTFLICAAVQYYSGWSSGFYFCGAFQIFWAIVWIFVVSDSPDKHSFISQDELYYLKMTVGTVFTIKLTNTEAPWKLILKSRPFWALCILNFGYAWMIISICIHGPLYYSTVLKYSIYRASALTALPFLLRLVLGTIIIQVYHCYKHNEEFKKFTNIRKYFIIVSHVIPGVLILTSWILPINPGPVLLTIAVALTAAGMDLTLEICYELSPTFANSLNTVIKILGNTPGIIIPFCVGQIIHKFQNTISVWLHLWCFHGLVIMFSGLIFLVWGEIHVQPWNEIRERPEKRLRGTARRTQMSKIIEVEEEDSTYPPSINQRQKIWRSLRLSN